ncbi:MAG TPA: ABC transporter substrate-binding protein [Candidatus Limnocylindria bacterium]|nr:ABC transporter substrate-binding protein [Candidatus Limnocylindria bacterium]
MSDTNELLVKRRYIYRLNRRQFLMASSAAALTACGPAATPAASAPATAPVKLKISYSNVIVDSLALWIAADNGTFLKNGIDVEVVSISSALGVAALLAGETGAAAIGGSEVLSAVAGGAELAIVGTTVGVYPHQFEVAPEIKTIADLKGKKIGVSSIGSSSDIATRVLLKRLGLDPTKDVTIIAVGSTDTRTAALLSGAIQAAVTLVPDTLLVEDKGFKPLYDLAALNLPASQTVIAVPRSLVAQKREVVQRIIDSLIVGNVRMRKDRAFAIATLKKYFKSTDDRAMAAAYESALKIVPVLPYPKREQFADAQATLGEKNEQVRTYDLGKLLDDSFVKSAADRGLDR